MKRISKHKYICQWAKTIQINLTNGVVNKWMKLKYI